MDAVQAHRSATPGHRVVGWWLDREERVRLLWLFPPRYPDVVADHVTLRPGVGPASPRPEESRAEIVGVSDDGRGVQALVVRIGGRSRRPDGSTYHITWSLAPGREAIQSNDVIAAHGWARIEPAVPVRLVPGLLE